MDTYKNNRKAADIAYGVLMENRISEFPVDVEKLLKGYNLPLKPTRFEMAEELGECLMSDYGGDIKKEALKFASVLTMPTIILYMTDVVETDEIKVKFGVDKTNAKIKSDRMKRLYNNGVYYKTPSERAYYDFYLNN